MLDVLPSILEKIFNIDVPPYLKALAEPINSESISRNSPKLMLPG